MLVLAMVWMALVVSVMAQSGTAPAVPGGAVAVVAVPVVSGWSAVLVAVVPLLVMVLKLLVPNVNSHWLPIAAVALGILGDQVLGILGSTSGNPLIGALCGVGAIGARELLDQVRKRMDSGGAAALFGFLTVFAVMGLLFGGCSTFTSTVSEKVENGITNSTTMVKAKTFWDSKSDLAKFAAKQTGKSQSIGIGSLSEESSGSNTVAVVNAVVGAAVNAAIKSVK
jgi:hypothetical protein